MAIKEQLFIKVAQVFVFSAGLINFSSAVFCLCHLSDKKKQKD
jgi:hypothetical protein